MKEITIDTITNNDEYTVPKTNSNMAALMSADYTKPTLIMLEDDDNDIVGIISTEVQGFYTEGDDDGDDNNEDEDNILTDSYRNSTKEKSGFFSQFKY